MRFSVVAAAAILAFLVSQNCHADLVFRFNRKPSTNDIVVRATGSGNVTGTQTSTDWDYINFNTSFLPLNSVLAISDLPAATVSGTLTNVTAATSSPILGFRIDNDSGGAGTDDLDFQTNNIAFTTGDEFTFSMLATFPAGTPTGFGFSSIVPGVHLDPGGGITDEIFGQATVVPEPSSFLFLGFAGVGTLIGRRLFRKRAN